MNVEVFVEATSEATGSRMSEQLEAVRLIRDTAVARLQRDKKPDNGYSVRAYEEGIELLLKCPPANALPPPGTKAPRKSAVAKQTLCSLDIWAGRKVLSLEWNEQTEEFAVLSFRRGDWEETILSW